MFLHKNIFFYFLFQKSKSVFKWKHKYESTENQFILTKENCIDYNEVSNFCKNLFLKSEKKLFLEKCRKYFFFPICFFTEEVSHFLGTKNSKTFFFLKKIFSKIVFAQKYFFEFCVSKKWLSSAVKKKQNPKKYFCAKTILENIFFRKTNLEKTFFIKKIAKYFFGKKNLEIFFSLFSRWNGGLSRGKLSGKFG